MRRITRHACEDAPNPEEQETEGQRQLHSLLLQQLDTEADIGRCVAKRKCFAPAALYKPFGEQAAGVNSLSRFRALQEGEQELASLRELGLTEQEVELWRTRDLPQGEGKVRSLGQMLNSGGIRADPAARLQRLQVIQEKMAARERVLSLPQRLSASRPLSRREIEIERALFHGSERLGFLSALYHQEEASQSGGSSSAPLDLLYRDVLSGKTQAAAPPPANPSVPQPEPERSCASKQSPAGAPGPSNAQSPAGAAGPGPSNAQSPAGAAGPGPSNAQSRAGTDPLQHPWTPAGQSQRPLSGGTAPLDRQKKISASQSIGSLGSVTGAGPGAPLSVCGPVEPVPEDEIRRNRETEAGIRSIPRFQNYQRGAPSEVLCIRNLSPRASLAQLVSLFSRFQPPHGPPLLYRLLTGRLKGQAYITFSDTLKAEAALELLNGYRLLEKPLVIEFGRERRERGREEQEGCGDTLHAGQGAVTPGQPPGGACSSQDNSQK